jgi:hypothetical protein
MVAALLALASMSVAALPRAALKRLFGTQAHYRSSQVASFVDGHRLDLVFAGLATLLVAFFAFLVAAMVELRSVTG